MNHKIEVVWIDVKCLRFGFPQALSRTIIDDLLYDGFRQSIDLE
ncbi:hypothetical protein [uncultured Zobellia sp.]|nr:hypothetical protein [uncultured Zobellia sp.]